jgi:hypothetical protein
MFDDDCPALYMDNAICPKVLFQEGHCGAAAVNATVHVG